MACDSNSAPHELTRQFYAWEMRGRGWQIYPWPSGSNRHSGRSSATICRVCRVQDAMTVANRHA